MVDWFQIKARNDARLFLYPRDPEFLEPDPGGLGVQLCLLLDEDFRELPISLHSTNEDPKSRRVRETIISVHRLHRRRKDMIERPTLYQATFNSSVNASPKYSHNALIKYLPTISYCSPVIPCAACLCAIRTTTGTKGDISLMFCA